MKVLKLGFIAWALLFASGLSLFSSGPASDLDPFWKTDTQATSEASPDHSVWQAVLDDYLVPAENDVNLMDYQGIQADNDPRLEKYIQAMAEIDPRSLSPDDQMAYWINMYNALTVDLIVKNYPVDSIRDIGKGFFSKGPWDQDVVEIVGRALTLNDIEHRILRPIFDDYRIHFVVNCASIGCPDLGKTAFTADNLEQQMDSLTRSFLAHPRGLSLENNSLRLSKIFQWYGGDFGDDEQAVLKTLANHVDDGIAERLRSFDGDIDYEYDWALNGL